jgi:hypothetical protein
MNAQSPRGLVVKDSSLFRTEGSVSDLVHEPGAPSSDEEGEEEEKEFSRPNGVPHSYSSNFKFFCRPLLAYTPPVQL